MDLNFDLSQILICLMKKSVPSHMESPRVGNSFFATVGIDYFFNPGIFF